MLPITIATNYTAPTTLVSTPIPNNNALHVPYDSVEPSVSSPELANNTRGNSIPAFSSDAATVSSEASSFGTLSANYSGDENGLGSQTTFFAQLIGQAEGSVLPQGLFGEYEKLVNDSQVKYKPSLADSAIPDNPANVFTQLLQQENAASAQVQQQVIAVPVVVSEQQPVAVPTPAPVIKTPAVKVSAPANDNEPHVQAPQASVPQSPVVKPAITAYTATVHRNNTASRGASFNEAA